MWVIELVWQTSGPDVVAVAKAWGRDRDPWQMAAELREELAD